MRIKTYFMIAAAAALLASCGGKRGGQPNFGDDEYPVVTVGTSSSASQTTYPATIKGVQDVEIRPKVAGFITKVNVPVRCFLLSTMPRIRQPFASLRLP